MYSDSVVSGSETMGTLSEHLTILSKPQGNVQWGTKVRLYGSERGFATCKNKSDVKTSKNQLGYC